MKILLIEPDKILAQTYSHVLKLDNHEVAIVQDAQIAIHAVDKFNPQLIILELQLSGHSGIEFLYELRSYSDWQAIPVLVHSVVPDKMLESIQADIDLLRIEAYLYKPQTTLQGLTQLVNHLAHTVPA